MEIAASLDRPVLFGAGCLDAGGPRNSAFLLGPAGDLIDRYDKVRLLPFGEYLPFLKQFPQIQKRLGHAGGLVPGRRLSPLCYGGTCFGVLICYEATFGDLSRDLVKKGAAFLVNITNDMWFGDTKCPAQHLMLASFRAVENRVWLVRCANTGISAFVDPAGRIRDSIPFFQQGEAVRSIEGLDIPTVYKDWGDWFPLSCTALLALLFLIGMAGRFRAARRS
jgi:apolipoprotein N-acyltransferase